MEQGTLAERFLEKEGKNILQWGAILVLAAAALFYFFFLKGRRKTPL